MCTILQVRRVAHPSFEGRDSARSRHGYLISRLPHLGATDFLSAFSTAFHRKFFQNCDGQPLLRIPESASWRDARKLSQPVFRQPPGWRVKIDS
jgi:hypothetical protein